MTLINLAEKFAFSERFTALFEEGMALVEECAAYLDGEGRKEIKNLDRNLATLYGTESMHLTTLLMQTASWLLLQRAANEGEMTREQLLDEKKKVKLDNYSDTSSKEGWDKLPAKFRNLAKRSHALQKRILTLDIELYSEIQPKKVANDNPVDQQINLLSAALGANKTG